MSNVPDAPDRHGELIEIADGLRSYLEHEKESGNAVVEADRNEVKKLSEALPVVSLPRVPAEVLFHAEPDDGSERLALMKGPVDRQAEMDRIAGQVAACRKCILHQTRTRVVPGQGTYSPEIMFVGEAPGFDEDQQGLAFVGRAGQLLTKMIAAMGFTRDQVFIANILKCRPPDNRPPMPEEMVACLPYLRAQIAVLRPKVIIALGGTAVRGLLGVETGITKLRGTWMKFEGIPTMPTLHPAYLLRNPPAKKDAWADLKEVLRSIGREPPPVAAAK